MSKNSVYGQKPLYYGNVNKGPMYYGSSQGPAYYGSAYGASAYGTRSPSSEDDDLVGAITLGRILRVIAQRWLSVLVFLVIGLIVSFAIYRISPTIYEAKSEFSVDMRRPSASSALGQMDVPDYGSTYEEVFNTRLSDWRSDKIVSKIVQQYRTDFPSSTVTDAELYEALYGSTLDLVRRSRLITIAIRSKNAALAAALANAYAQAIEVFTDEENKLRCDKAVAQIHEQVEKQRRIDESLSRNLLDFRTRNQVDNLRAEREIVQQSLQKTTAEVLTLESQVTAAVEWEKVLQAAQETPENFGALPSNVPRSSEISMAYTALQTTTMEMTGLLAKFTKNHPEVRAKEKELESIKKHFVESVSRALATAHGNLSSFRNQLAVFKSNSEKLRKQLNELDQKIVSADAGLQQLEREKEVASGLYQNLLQKEHEARIQAEQNNEIVRVGRPANVPNVPVLPNPILIFAAGFFVSLIAGLTFVLILDNIEDTIVGLSDIEVRLALKVLAVLPHIRRKKREQVARFILENKYSQFAEGIAGLRNLLDSPRYQPVTQSLLLISTQPAEGKTISSCSLAISNAMSGRKTLLVDFDLRRPRLAGIFELNLEQEKSLSHFLASTENDGKFDKLVNKDVYENLDVIASLPPNNVNPASIMGSHVLVEFFQWARANYSRVIVDAPPFGIVGDVVTLAGLVDSVIILCCPEKSHFKPIQHCSRVLRESGASILGVLVNDVEVGSYGNAFNETGSRYGYGYRGYGYRAYGDDRPYAPEAQDAPQKTEETIASGEVMEEEEDIPVSSHSSASDFADED